MPNIIGEAIDPTRIDQEVVDGKPYWQLIPDVEYSIDGNKRVGALLVATALGFEQTTVKTLEGKEQQMMPAFYTAELLLDSTYHLVTLRFFRVELDPETNRARRRLVDVVPSPLVDDFLPRIQRLIEGGVRVVKPQHEASFEVLAAEAAKRTEQATKSTKSTKKKADSKKATVKSPASRSGKKAR